MFQSFVFKTVRVLIFFLLILFVFSCRKDIVEDSGQSSFLSYFPLDTGYWVEYVADSVVHLDDDDVNAVDTAIRTYHFYIREEVDTPFIDGENQKTFVISRFRRESDTLPWSFMSVWTAKVNAYSAQRVEDNVRFLRLKFPINENTTWNGNALNYYDAEEYSYENLYDTYHTGLMDFDSSVTVLQNDFVSLINRVYKKEVYAKNAGLLFKELDSVSTMNTANGTIILNGTEYKLNITGYGH